MSARAAALALVVAAGLHAPALADGYLAEVVRVVDGDTYEVRRGDEVIALRLHGVDTPEVWPGQYKCEAERALGVEASLVAGELLGSVVRVDETGGRSFDRYVARIWVIAPDAWYDLGNALIRLGVAREWDYDAGEAKPDWCNG